MLWGANVSPQSKKFNFVLHKITPAILAWFDLEDLLHKCPFA